MSYPAVSIRQYRLRINPKLYRLGINPQAAQLPNPLQRVVILAFLTCFSRLDVYQPGD